MGEPRRIRRRSPAPASANGGSGEDHISRLTDELLHDILVRLGCTQAAARTSVLSRRWRHVWAHLPTLRFFAGDGDIAASFMGSVDAALGGYLAPNLENLAIAISTKQPDAPSARIARWLHFAAEHVVGELYLSLHGPRTWRDEGPEMVHLEVPVCEEVKRIVFFLKHERATCLRPQASGQFKALTYLKIGGYRSILGGGYHSIRMEGSDITALVNTQCPCLSGLNLSIELIVNFDVSIHSNSLCTMVLDVLETRRLEILAPRLDELTITTKPTESHISAPQLVKLDWHDAYDPHLHQFDDVGRTLRVLKIFDQASSLTKRFDEVDVLYMRIHIDGETYGRFLNETNKLPKCKRFDVFLRLDCHALVPIMLQLLRSCCCTIKFRVDLFADRSWSTQNHSCLPPCPCRLEESYKIDGIDLSSLEEVEIIGFSGSHQQMELVEFISSNAGILKRLVIFDSFCQTPKEACAKIRSMCRPTVRVELYGFRD